MASNVRSQPLKELITALTIMLSKSVIEAPRGKPERSNLPDNRGLRASGLDAVMRVSLPNGISAALKAVN